MHLFSTADNLVLRAHPMPLRGARSGGVQHVTFEAGHQFWTAKKPARYAAFPLRGVISLRASADERKSVEVAQVGREGFADVPVLLGAAKKSRTAGERSHLNRAAR